MSPSPDDAEAIHRHAVAVLCHLSIEGRSERVRLAAAELLLALADKLQAAQNAEPSEQARLLGGLRRVYRKVTKFTGIAEMPPSE
jgi:hypothetical protein